ncbi:MAG: YbaB/EbfC family nucleoid-associated protein [Eubacteriales bacterium]|jgi:DNA-binding YbaB/EbfC family protein
MSRRNNFQGIPGSANNMMKQAQRLQRQLEEQQKALEEQEFTAAAGGGAVEVTVSGKHQLTNVKIDPEAVDPDDVEMLQDLIMAAANEALKKVDDAQVANMSKMTGGFGGLSF